LAAMSRRPAIAMPSIAAARSRADISIIIAT
jgi:hypothetical protein